MLDIFESIQRSLQRLVDCAENLVRSREVEARMDAVEALRDALSDHRRRTAATLHGELLARGEMQELVFELMEQYATIALLVHDLEEAPPWEKRFLTGAKACRRLLLETVHLELGALVVRAKRVLSSERGRRLGAKHERLPGIDELAAELVEALLLDEADAPPSSPSRRLH